MSTPPVLNAAMSESCRRDFEPTASTILRYEQIVRIFSLRIFVERFEIRVRRRRIEIEVDLFDVFGVIAFVPVEAEEPLLEDRVLPIPKGRRKAEPALPIANSQQAVFAPAIRAAASMVVREIIPTLASG